MKRIRVLSKLPTFMLGAIVGVAVTAGSTVGAVAYLKATQSSVKIVVDGTQAKLSDSPLNVNGKLYLPVRDTANALGYSVESVTSSQVSLKEGTSTSQSTTNSNITNGQNSSSSTIPSPSNNTTTSKKVNNLKETYSTDGKLDAAKIRAALNNGTLGVNDQDIGTGKTLLMFVIEEDNYEAYKAIKRNALDPDVQDNNKQTALHVAVQLKNSFYFGELINDLKPDAKLKDSDGKQAIDYSEFSSFEYSALKGYML